MDWGKKFQKRYIALGFLDLRVTRALVFRILSPLVTGSHRLTIKSFKKIGNLNFKFKVPNQQVYFARIRFLNWTSDSVVGNTQ